MSEMAAQMARMGQLAIDVENLKNRNALLEAELAQVNRVRGLRAQGLGVVAGLGA